MTASTPTSVRAGLDQLLERYQSALVDQSADELAALYAPGASHVVPFTFPGVPQNLQGPDAIRAAYERAWSISEAKPDRVETLATYLDPSSTSLVVEQVVHGTVTSTGERFAFPGILVLTSDGTSLTAVHDYMDGLGVARALGRLRAVVDALEVDGDHATTR